MSHPQCIFLAGAPISATLNWSESELEQDFDLRVQSFLSPQQRQPPIPSTQISSNWRGISLKDKLFYQSPNTKVQQHRLEERLTGELLDEQDEDDDDDFLEHSFAVHADIKSSALTSSSHSEDEEISTFVTDDSALDSDTTVLADASTLSNTEIPPLISAYHQFSGPITNIRAMPTAEHLQRLQPQTMTVNIIAGVISVAPTRTVRVRRGNYDMDIIELVLGDESKAGFTVTSWHMPDDSQKRPDPLRVTLRSLRPQDVVLIEQLALSSFKGLVFGQSLNRRLSRAMTRMTVVVKAEAVGKDLPPEDPPEHMLSRQVAAKLQRAVDWVASFIGPTTKGRGETHRSTAGGHKWKHIAVEEEYLPPDSQ